MRISNKYLKPFSAGARTARPPTLPKAVVVCVSKTRLQINGASFALCALIADLRSVLREKTFLYFAVFTFQKI
jgi:hypothetical protein